MKSIVFTVLRDELLSEQKTQTIRVIYIPTYIEGEVVKIVFKYPKDEKGERKRELLYLAQIIEIYPKKIKELTREEAINDGFASLRELKWELRNLNNLSGDKWEERFCFVIKFKKLQTLERFIDKKECSMKVMVTGSRTIMDKDLIWNCLRRVYEEVPFSVLIEGGAGDDKDPEKRRFSVDLYSRAFAEELGIETDPTLPDWSRHGRGAPFIRNKEMAEKSGFGISIWDGYSNGTKHGMDCLVRLEKLYYIFVNKDRLEHCTQLYGDKGVRKIVPIDIKVEEDESNYF